MRVSPMPVRRFLRVLWPAAPRAPSPTLRLRGPLLALRMLAGELLPPRTVTQHIFAAAGNVFLARIRCAVHRDQGFEPVCQWARFHDAIRLLSAVLLRSSPLNQPCRMVFEEYDVNWLQRREPRYLQNQL